MLFQQKNVLPFLALSLLLLGLPACQSDDDAPPNEGKGKFESGYFILCAGNGTDKGTLDFWDEKTGKVRKEVFEDANGGEKFDGFIKSMYIHQGLAYIVVSDKGRVVVADADDFFKVADIQGFAMPQHFLPVGDERAFVSQWGPDSLSGSVAVVNLQTRQIEKTIATGIGSGRMIRLGERVYVANEGGSRMSERDSFLTVIDLASEEVSHKIAVGTNPNSLQVDKNGALWVLCGGSFVNFNDWNSPDNHRAKLVKIVNDEVIQSSQFYWWEGSDLVISDTGDRLFYLDAAYGNAVFGFGIEQDSLNFNALIYSGSRALGFYPAKKKLLLATYDNLNLTGGIVRVFDTIGNESPVVKTSPNPIGFWPL